MPDRRAALPRLTDEARAKTYLGYSDDGALLAGLYARGFRDVAHGPMPVDITREGGEAAVKRALACLVDRAPEALEPTSSSETPTAAFNIMILSHLLGTPLEPDLAGHVLMLEEVAEYMYRIDRALFHITCNPRIAPVAGIKLGRCSAIPQNDPDFGQNEDEIARTGASASGIPYLGRADIGHDVDNKVVPFGRLRPTRYRVAIRPRNGLRCRTRCQRHRQVRFPTDLATAHAVGRNHASHSPVARLRVPLPDRRVGGRPKRRTTLDIYVIDVEGGTRRCS